MKKLCRFRLPSKAPRNHDHPPRTPAPLPRFSKIHVHVCRKQSKLFRLFHKGENFCDFLFAFLRTKPYLKMGLLLKERICSRGETFFCFKVDPFFSEGRYKNHDRVASFLENASIPFHHLVVNTTRITWITHYENTPIQIYRQFQLQKLKNFR